MSGHSKWVQIKHQKGAADAKKSKVFSKIARLIAIAAKKGKDPAMNPVLKEAISKAKEANMSLDNIQRAIKRGAGESKDNEKLEEVLYEAFGPGNCAILIGGITDNKNRALGEVRQILSKHELQLAGTGSCIWAFEKIASNSAKGGVNWRPKHAINITKENQEKLKTLLKELNELDDTQDIITNCVIDD